MEKPAQIVFTANATAALNMGLKGILRPGNHVATTVTDHNSVLRPLRSLIDRGEISASWVACDSTGYIAPQSIRDVLRHNTRLVCMTHASNVTGTLHDIGAIGAIGALARENGTLLMIDGTQTAGCVPAGCVPIDVQAMQIDLLAFTGHKALLGPQGTGGLYIRPGLDLQPLYEGGGGSESASDRQPQKMPDRYEAGTPNTPGLAGLGAALRFVIETGVETIQARERELTGASARSMDRTQQR